MTELIAMERAEIADLEDFKNSTAAEIEAMKNSVPLFPAELPAIENRETA